MYLEKLELIGFKSFADKTDIHFEKGLTAVVGPNGCGKSNVVDAIKWVMGEQSVKSLRGVEMTDVIFNGTTHRKSMGYAEVSLNFSNTKNILPVDYDQVRVTRRLYRTGESEYFLNKTRCRLKDIKDLFMGTGVGVNAYSVIEQGRIDILLQSNAQERRVIFEEAAGISKYKQKKKTALNKMERVEQNLTRLSDIIAEVQKQMRSLHRQVGKARRFREFSLQLKEIKTEFSLHQYHLLQGDYESLRETVNSSQTEHDQKQARIENMDAEASRLATVSVEIEQRLRELEGQRMEIDGRINTCENDIRRSRERINETEEAHQRVLQEIETITERIQELKADLLHTITDMDAAQTDIRRDNDELNASEDGLRSLSDEAIQLGRQIQTHRSEMMDLMNERNQFLNQRASLESDQRLIDAQLNRHRRRKEEIDTELAELQMIRRDTEKAVEELSERLARCHDRLESISREIAGLEESLLSLDERMAERRDKLSAKESRLQTLQDLERRREGMGTGVKHVLNAIQGEQPQLEGLFGTVAELFDVDVEYALAIEAALTTSAQMVVAEDTDRVRAAIEFLRRDDHGRATFLPLDRARPASNALPPISDHPSYIGPAIKFIRAREPHQEVLRQLLAGTHIFRDLETALELAPKFPPSAHLVTLAGDLVASSGPITGGGSTDRMGIISRRSEIRQLDREVTQIRELMNELAGERNQTIQRLQKLREHRESTQQEITDINIQLSERRSTLEQSEREIAELEQELAVISSEVGDLRQQLARNSELREEMDRCIAETEQKENDFKAALVGLEQQQKDIDQRRDVLRESVTRFQASLAGLRQKLEGQKTSRENGFRTLQEQKDQLLARHREIEQLELRIKNSLENISSAETNLESLFEERRQKKETLRVESNSREGLRAEVDKNAEDLRQAHNELRTIDEHIQDLRVRESKAQIKTENLLEQSRQELDIDLPEAHKDYFHDEEKDWDSMHEEVLNLERKIKNLGNVYEDAIEEYESLELRFQTLTTQEQDLLEAKKKLQEIVRKINRTSRRMFETTFEMVRENFQTIFAKLFGGGRADIFLEEGVDILEAGIEIVARPPGKSENTILSLLSGGEKALCTVALLFAIFRARPSPFCILDEVDAPLDESNIDRFVGLVLEFNINTQFLIVTHNRRTMRSADSIYGITMQEPGVSTKVSVRFEDMEETRL